MEENMNLEEIYFLTQIGVGVAVIISIIFVGLELRQNSFLMRKSMGDTRKHRVNWLFEQLSIDEDFRVFFQRITTDYKNFTDDEKFRATCLGARSLRGMLDELVDHFEGRTTKEEWIALEWELKHIAKRPNTEPAYQQFLKNSYPEKVEQYWESLPKS